MVLIFHPNLRDNLVAFGLCGSFVAAVVVAKRTGAPRILRQVAVVAPRGDARQLGAD